MKIYILKPRKTIKGGPWDPWYNKVFGIIVRAGSKQQARLLAGKCEAGQEPAEAWLDPEFSSCEELDEEGDPEIIMRDFRKS